MHVVALPARWHIPANDPLTRAGDSRRTAARSRWRGGRRAATGSGMARLYRGIGNNVWTAESGEALFFSTDPLRAAAFGKLHYIDVTAAEFAKFERPHSKRILIAERTMIDELHVQRAMVRRLDTNFGLLLDEIRAVHQSACSPRQPGARGRRSRRIKAARVFRAAFNYRRVLGKRRGVNHGPALTGSPIVG